jgi:secreted trypsin-like serine protease
MATGASHQPRRVAAGKAAALVAAVGLAGGLYVAVRALDTTSTGRTLVGRPVVGVVALINATSPADSIFNGQFCGGTLIAADRVLTAAHCVIGTTPSRIHAVVGADNLCRGHPIDGERIAVTSITRHPRYDSQSGRYDLAELILQSGVPGEVRLLADQTEPVAGARLTALGWGRMSTGGVPACRLMRVSLRLLSPTDCTDEVGSVGARRYDTSSMVCAVPAGETGSDTCTGDSGGPLLIGDDLDQAALFGVTSWGRGCGTGLPGIYARAARSGSGE